MNEIPVFFSILYTPLNSQRLKVGKLDFATSILRYFMSSSRAHSNKQVEPCFHT